MTRDVIIVACALAVALLAPLLMSCTPLPAAASSSLAMTQQQFEEAVEEGFGPIDRLPPAWAMLPK